MSKSSTLQTNIPWGKNLSRFMLLSEIRKAIFYLTQRVGLNSDASVEGVS